MASYLAQGHSPQVMMPADPLIPVQCRFCEADLNYDAGAWNSSYRLGSRRKHVAIRVLYSVAVQHVGCHGGDGYMRHIADAGQGLASEPQSSNGVQILIHPQLGGGVPAMKPTTATWPSTRTCLPIAPAVANLHLHMIVLGAQLPHHLNTSNRFQTHSQSSCFTLF